MTERLADLAIEEHFVCHQQPDWKLELVAVLAVVLAFALVMAIAAATNAADVSTASDNTASFWKRRSEKIETTAVVRLEADGVGFQCRQFNIRREWELVIAKKCEELGSLLIVARGTP